MNYEEKRALHIEISQMLASQDLIRVKSKGLLKKKLRTKSSVLLNR